MVLLNAGDVAARLAVRRGPSVPAITYHESGDVVTDDTAADSLDNMRLIESIMQHAFNSSVVDYQARLEPSAS
jgi:hypothetical protein